MKRHAIRIAIRLLLPALLLVAWDQAATRHLLPPSLSAPLASIARTFFRLAQSGMFRNHVISSVVRLSIAVSIGSALGIATGLLLSQAPRLRDFLNPTIRLMAPVPVIAWMPFVIATVGTDEPYKIFMVALATFFIMNGHAFDGGTSVSRRLIELALIYEKPFHERILKIILPAASPLIFSGLRLSLALAWVILMFVEFGSAKAGSEGLGWFVADARALGKVEEEYAGVLLIAILGLITDSVAASMCKRAARWSLEPQTS